MGSLLQQTVFRYCSMHYWMHVPARRARYRKGSAPTSSPTKYSREPDRRRETPSGDGHYRHYCWRATTEYRSGERWRSAGFGPQIDQSNPATNDDADGRAEKIERVKRRAGTRFPSDPKGMLRAYDSLHTKTVFSTNRDRAWWHAMDSPSGRIVPIRLSSQNIRFRTLFPADFPGAAG